MWTGSFPRQTATDPQRSGWWAQWAFSNRSGGVSGEPYESLNLADYVGDDPVAVEQNRMVLGRELDGQIGQPRVSVTVMGARHGADVAVVDERMTLDVHNSLMVEGFDGLVTNTPNVAVVALVADCVPVLLADVEHGVVAAVHCGWRGLVAGVVEQTLQKMMEMGATSETVYGIAGPAICGPCYGVPLERVRAVQRVAQASVATSRSGGPALDVRIGVMAQLHSQGVAATMVGGCTNEDPDLFSYRRDGVTGRQGGAIVLRVL